MSVKLRRENPRLKGRTLKNVAREILRNCFFAEKNWKILIILIIAKILFELSWFLNNIIVRNEEERFFIIKVFL